MRISPAAGTGTGHSRITKGVRGRSRTIARTAVDPFLCPLLGSPDGSYTRGRNRVINPLMFKLIGILLAIMPIVLFLRAIFFGRSKKTSQAVSEFKKQLDFAVWVILFFIGCAVVYSIGKLIYQFWT